MNPILVKNLKFNTWYDNGYKNYYYVYKVYPLNHSIDMITIYNNNLESFNLDQNCLVCFTELKSKVLINKLNNLLSLRIFQ